MRNILLSGAVLALLTAPALAWDTPPAPVANAASHSSARAAAHATATSRSQSRSNSSSISAGGSATGGTANATGGSVLVTGSNGGGSGGVGPLGNFVPDGTGQAPCGGGLGAGGAGLSLGAGIGGTIFEFGDCKRLREVTALRAIAHETRDPRVEQAALNELCQIDRVKEAFGGHCPIVGTTIVTDVNADKNDYCFTRNAGDLDQHRECDSVHRVRRPFPASVVGE